MTPRAMRDEMIVFAVMAVLLAMVPFTGIYPFFVMQALCFALLACAFNLLIGYGGLLSFGHAMFLGTAGYVSAHALKVWGLPPELGILAGVGAALSAVMNNVAALALLMPVDIEAASNAVELRHLDAHRAPDDGEAGGVLDGVE